MTFRTALLCLALLLVAVPAMATSYVMVSDENLLQRSTAVVEARVLSVDDAPSGSPATDYMIEVDRVLAGEVSGRNLIVRVPGGVGPDGVGLHFYGMPRFGIGEQVVLFLGTRPDGTYRIAHLMLGAFHQTVIDGKRALVRDLTGARELTMPGAAGSREIYHQPREAAAFARWVEARGRGDEAPAEYFLELPEGEEAAVPQIAERFRLFSDSGRNIRWFVFDAGDHAEWRMQTGGQQPFGQNRSADAFQKGMAAWNNDGGSTVDYRYVGTTNSTEGFDGCGASNCTDGVNALIFNDADGSIDDPFDCSRGGGGTLAVGGPWFQNGPLEVRQGPGGQTYNVIIEAEIIVNSNVDCFLDAAAGGPDLAMQQLFAHELGHTLGIDHPCEDDGGCPPLQRDALMHAFFHNDGRGAVLNSDDRGAVRTLYPGASDKPAPPTNLAGMAVSPTEVFLTWTDNAVDESFFRLQIKQGDGGFVDHDENPLANVEELEVGGLLPETLYTFRIEARNGSGGSGFSNELQILMPPDLPAAPANLVASSLSSTAVALSWTDMADDENDFVVEMRTAESGTWTVVREGILPNSESTTITDLTPDVPYSFRVFARNEKGLSFPSDPVAVTPVDGGLTGCTPDGQTLCLLQDQFKVTVQWRHPNNGNHGAGGAAPLPSSGGSDRSGTFWFFNDANTELIVKVLDGRLINGFYWTFYGSLSNVEYWISVVDTTDGSSRTYYNPPGERCGELDTNSIAGTDQPVEGGAGLAVMPLDPADGGSGGAGTLAPVTAVTAADGTCVESDTTLCLLEDRFAVTVDWDATARVNGTAGVGTAVPGSDKTGYFWFFNDDNIELVVKALDGRPVNGKFWLFYGQLTDVEFDITVTDTVTGVERTFSNAFRNTCGQFLTDAFDPEPEEPELP